MNQELHGRHEWTQEIPDEQWRIYRRVIEVLAQKEIQFALGGAFALAAYTGRWRNTKDLDLYVLPQDRQEVIDLLSALGMEDYFEIEEYDRSWIYRAYQGEVIVDTIWAMANARVEVDPLWLRRGVRVPVRGLELPVLPVEELIWAKLYVLQRERSDWPDVLNLVHAAGPAMDWDHLIQRLGDDLPILAGMMALFRWLDPMRARQLPESLWERLHLPQPEAGGTREVVEVRASRLDSRPWFYSLL
jgi:hypothetical protein